MERLSITLNNEFYQIELNEMVMVDNGCYTLNKGNNKITELRTIL